MQLFVSSEKARQRAVTSGASANTPNFVAPSYNMGHSGTLVDTGQLLAVLRSSAKGYHFDVVDKIISSVVDCGFTMRISHKNELIRLSTSDEKIVEQRWADLAREALRCVLTVGFVAINVGPIRQADPDTDTQDAEQDKTVHEPAVIPLELITIHFRQSALDPRKVYWVEDRRTHKVIDCLLWVDRAPDAFGNLTSCGSSLLDAHITAEHIAGDKLSADYVRSHPVYAFEHTTSGIARQDPSHTDTYLPGEVDELHARAFHHISERERSATENAMHNASAAANSVLEQAASDPLLPAMPSSVKKNTQYLKPLFVPPNMHLVSAPVPQLNPDYQYDMDTFERRVRGAYKVTQETMDPKHGQKLAASSDKNEKEWKERIKTLQSMLVPMISDCFMRVNNIRIESYAKTQSSRSLDTRLELVTRIANEERQKLAARAEQSAYQHPNPADWTPADPLPAPPRSRAELEGRYRKRRLRDPLVLSTRTAADRDVPELDQGDYDSDDSDPEGSSEVATIITNESGEKQLGDTPEALRRLVATMMEAGDEQPENIIGKMQVVVEFKNLPSVTLEQLAAFYSSRIMDRFEYAKQVARITGINEELFVTSPEKAFENALLDRDLAEKSAIRLLPEGDTNPNTESTPAGSRSKSARIGEIHSK